MRKGSTVNILKYSRYMWEAPIFELFNNPVVWVERRLWKYPLSENESIPGKWLLYAVLIVKLSEAKGNPEIASKVSVKQTHTQFSYFLSDEVRASPSAGEVVG